MLFWPADFVIVNLRILLVKFLSLKLEKGKDFFPYAVIIPPFSVNTAHSEKTSLSLSASRQNTVPENVKGMFIQL